MTTTDTTTLASPQRPARLKRAADFDSVMRRGRRGRGSLLHVAHRPNDLEASRVGYSVSRRVGNAVTRNRVKRRLRELVADHHLIGGRDVVVLAQPAAAQASFVQLSRDFDAQLQRSGLEHETTDAAPPVDGHAEAASDAAELATADESSNVSPAARVVLALIRGYQRLISPAQPAACRYEPTCSAYGVTAVERHGAARGFWLATKRLLRCRPGSEGGYDPVPER